MTLVDALSRCDPAAVLWGQLKGTRWNGQGHFVEATEKDKETLMPMMARCFANRKILNLSGGSDKLVPYRNGKSFLDWLKKATGRGGWFEGGGFHLEDIIIDGAGHEVTPEMVEPMVKFVHEAIESGTDKLVEKTNSSRGSKL